MSFTYIKEGGADDLADRTRPRQHMIIHGSNPGTGCLFMRPHNNLRLGVSFE